MRLRPARKEGVSCTAVPFFSYCEQELVSFFISKVDGTNYPFVKKTLAVFSVAN